MKEDLTLGEMEGLKLNEECCFSCLQPFDTARSEIIISDNTEAIRRILDINFLVDKPNESMNLCLSCYSTFQEAKEDYLRLVELEKQFNSKRTKFAFKIVKSCEDDDYLGTSIEDHFLNARAKIYTKWQKVYKSHVADNPDSVDEQDGGVIDAGVGNSSVPQSKVVVKPVIITPVAMSSSSQAVKRVAGVHNGQGSTKEVTRVSVAPTRFPGGSSVVNVAGVNANARRKVIFVRRDPLTGAVHRVKPAIADVGKTVRYRINNQAGSFSNSTIRLVNPQTGAQNVLRIQQAGTIVKKSNPVLQQPQARPIVRTPIPTPTKFVPIAKAQPKAVTPAPVIVARKSLPVDTTAAKPSVSEISEDFEQQNGPEKRRRKESVQPTAVTYATQISVRSRRVIKKPVDSSCLYGNEYERAVKNSSKKTQMKTRTVKRSSDTTADMDEDSYRYDEDNHYEEAGTLDQFEYDVNIGAEAEGEEADDMEC